MQREWNSFWAGHGQGAALAEAPIDAPSLTQGWRDFFNSFKGSAGVPLTLADLACGTGEVAGHAREVLERAVRLTCLDYAPAAVETLLADTRIDEALVGDAAALPFGDQSFDIVCSQFGVEYAGQGAFAEAARITARGGSVRIVAHLKQGAIWAECEANARTVGGVIESGLFEAAKKTFTVMGQIRRGLASPQDLSGPHSEVTSAVPALQATIKMAPQGSAGRVFAERLYTDLARIFDRITAYEPQDIIDWCEAMSAETLAYQSRMTSMTEAALDEEGVGRCQSLMMEAGVDMLTPQTLEDRHEPIAWVLEGKRPA